MTISALEPSADAVVARLAKGSWANARFFLSSAAAARTPQTLDDIAGADLVVMIATAGEDASAAAAIGQLCSERRLHTAAIVIRTVGVSEEALSRTLRDVRPWSLTVVIAGDGHSVEDILRSFRQDPSA